MRRTLLVFFAVAFLLVAPRANAATKNISIGPAGNTNPGDLTINGGDTVKWTNDDPTPTSHDLFIQGDKVATIQSGKSFSHTFDDPGPDSVDIPYSIDDANGPGGTITVQPIPTTTTTQATTTTTTTKSTTTTSSTTTSTSTSSTTTTSTSTTTTTTLPVSSGSGTIAVNNGGGGGSSALPLILGALVVVAGLAVWRTGCGCGAVSRTTTPCPTGRKNRRRRPRGRRSDDAPACGGRAGAGDRAASADDRARAASGEVNVGEDHYSPSQVSITAGETVVWTYGGSGSHSVTADDGSFDSSPTCGQLLGPCMGASFSHQFNSPGTFAYHCRIVPAMVGTVTVEAPSTTTTSRPASTSTTTTSTTSPSSETSTSLASDQPTITQAALPSRPSERAAPKSIIRSGRTDDDLRPWVFLDVGIAGTTTIVGAVLVRRGRVPFG